MEHGSRGRATKPCLAHGPLQGAAAVANRGGVVLSPRSHRVAADPALSLQHRTVISLMLRVSWARHMVIRTARRIRTGTRTGRSMGQGRVTNVESDQVIVLATMCRTKRLAPTYAGAGGSVRLWRARSQPKRRQWRPCGSVSCCVRIENCTPPPLRGACEEILGCTLLCDKGLRWARAVTDDRARAHGSD